MPSILSSNAFSPSSVIYLPLQDLINAQVILPASVNQSLSLVL